VRSNYVNLFFYSSNVVFLHQFGVEKRPSVDHFHPIRWTAFALCLVEWFYLRKVFAGFAIPQSQPSESETQFAKYICIIFCSSFESSKDTFGQDRYQLIFSGGQFPVAPSGCGPAHGCWIYQDPTRRSIPLGCSRILNGISDMFRTLVGICFRTGQYQWVKKSQTTTPFKIRWCPLRKYNI